jgi:hypothetical protein
MWIYNYINTRGNRENEKLCGNMFTQFRVFPISTSISIRKNVLYIFYNIAQRNIKKEIFRVDIELYQQGSQPISVQNLQMLVIISNIIKSSFETHQTCILKTPN